MSASRLVLSSPFDIPQRKRPPDVNIKVPTRYNGCKARNRNVNNIMVDTRVVRRSIFSTNNAQKNTRFTGWEQSTPYILFDKRLIDGNSLYANPIVKVSVAGGNANVKELKKKYSASPVKGRKHVCIQTDNESIDKCF